MIWPIVRANMYVSVLDFLNHTYVYANVFYFSIYVAYEIQETHQEMDSERELSLRRHRTRTTKYNRLMHKFRHRSTRRLCVGTYVCQIQ